MLAGNPFVTARKAEEHLGVAFNTANKAIALLEDQGILQKLGEAQRGRVYVARALLDILEEPARLTG
jgi:Fic family protein